MAQSSIAIAVCDQDFTVRFFNSAMAQIIDRAHCTIMATPDAFQGETVLRQLGVDDVAAVAALIADGSWEGSSAKSAVHVAIESFVDENSAGGWLITACTLVDQAPPKRATERELIARSAKLTPRERQVTLALEEGASNKVIALRLGISPRTVEFHRAKIMHRFAAKSVIDLVRKVISDAPQS